MKIFQILGISLVFSTGLMAQAPSKATGNAAGFALTSLTDSASYAIGQNIAQAITQDLKNLNKKAFLNAIQTVFDDQTPRFQEDQLRSILTAFAEQQQALESKAVIDAGAAFLAKNKTQPGIVTTASGLQYKILKKGVGASPTAADTVICHYRGQLLDSTEFDNSYERGAPLTIGVGDVIKGWTEGLQLMAPGAKYRFYVPYELGYGLQGSPPTIPGGTVLIFEIELLEVKKAAADPAPATTLETPTANQTSS